MGMFDSLYVNCPECGNELEFQSKSGECFCSSYKKGSLTPQVAIGMDGDVVRCQFCNYRIKLICNIPIKVKIKLESLGKRKGFNYNGNYNPKHSYSIERQKHLSKIFGKQNKEVKEK